MLFGSFHFKHFDIEYKGGVRADLFACTVRAVTEVAGDIKSSLTALA